MLHRHAPMLRWYEIGGLDGFSEHVYHSYLQQTLAAEEVVDHALEGLAAEAARECLLCHAPPEN